MSQRPEILYEVCGPYRIPRPKGGMIEKMPAAWWRSMNVNGLEVSSAKGVYIFGIRARGSSRIIPCYVGKTEKKSFANECFSSSKLHHYNSVLHEYGFRNLKPFLFLLARLTKGGRVAIGHKRDIDFMEDYLIGLCLQQNKNLRNIRKTKFLKRIVLPGLLNPRPGHPGQAALDLRRTLTGEV